MTHLKNTFKLACLLLALFGMVACGGEAEVTVDPEEMSGGTATPQDIAFFQAWLADCTADTVMAGDEATGLAALTSLALSRINGALQSKLLKDTFGDMGNTTIWGPVIRPTASEKGVITDNLLYAVKSVSGNETSYSIGVSGTNVISHFGWFDEDFAVDTQTPWSQGEPQKGVISTGSHTGLGILMAMEDAKQTMIQFLSDQIESASPGTSIRITVAGHSLGGALAPLLALKIKESFLDKTNVSVEGWAYAGPTPGDAAFGTYMTSTLDKYSAYNNTLDVVPHAWQLDSIDKICDIYANLNDNCNYGDKVVAGSIVSGVATWAIGQSSAAPSPYQEAGTPVTFTKGPMTFTDSLCYSLGSDAQEMEAFDLGLYLKFRAVAEACKSVDDVNALHNLKYFFAFMTELGYQHTTPYVEEFFPSAAVATEVHKFVHGGKGKPENALALDVIKDLIEATHDYLEQNSGIDCNCVLPKKE